jgi:hypothetical protein
MTENTTQTEQALTVRLIGGLARGQQLSRVEHVLSTDVSTTMTCLRALDRRAARTEASA